MAKSSKIYNEVRRDVMRAFIYNKNDAYIPLSETQSIRVSADKLGKNANFDYLFFDVSRSWYERALLKTNDPMEIFESAKDEHQLLMIKFM